MQCGDCFTILFQYTLHAHCESTRTDATVIYSLNAPRGPTGVTLRPRLQRNDLWRVRSECNCNGLQRMGRYGNSCETGFVGADASVAIATRTSQAVAVAHGRTPRKCVNLPLQTALRLNNMRTIVKKKKIVTMTFTLMDICWDCACSYPQRRFKGLY